MQNRPRKSLLGSVFFPFEDDQIITGKQEAILIFRLILFFPVPMTLLALIWAIVVNAPLSRIILIPVIVFVVTSLLFGIQAWFITKLSNQSNRLRQENAQKSQQQ